MSYPAKIQLAQPQQDELERCAKGRTVAARAVERAKIILQSAAGKAKREIAEQLGIARQTVRRWEKRFLQQGTEGLEDSPRSGRPRRIQPEQIAQIVQKTTQETPADSTHWSTRSLAQVVNVSPNSVVWSADEQCQLHALSRTQPSLPCVPEHCATKTQDYGRKGITNLFAAMNVHSGEIVYTFHPQHRHEEWIQFLSLIEIATPPGKEIHLIMDNYSAHKHVAVSQWLDEHPRFHVHWTPTSGSWLNAVERLFGDVTQKCLRRRSVDSVAALEQAIGDFLDKRNQNPKPLKWKATAVEILRKVQRAWATLHDLYGAKKPSAALRNRQ